MQKQFLDLLSLPEDKRDLAWEQEFFKLLPQAKLDLLYPDPKPGPDHWPYIFAKVEEESEEPSMSLLAWLSERGIGLAINPHKDLPDYILPYGMIWFFRETGKFLSDHLQFRGQKLEIKDQQKYYSGEPSKAYIPDYVRKLVREFLRQQGIHRPRVCMISEDQEHWDLCFSIESLGNPPSHEHAGIAEAISWFFPAHYSIVLLRNQDFLNFYDL